MYRAQPKASKLLSAKWQEKDHQIHLAKLQNIKSAIKVQRPQEHAHLRSKPKKNQMLEGKDNIQRARASTCAFKCGSANFEGETVTNV